MTVKNAKLITRIKFTLPSFQRKEYPMHSSLEDGNYIVNAVLTLVIVTHNYKTFATHMSKILRKH
jgi:hypothetical protein